jgi:hypothetical protein
MHDCLKTREILVDLAFDELDQETRRRVLLELGNCQDCQAHYRSMTETLRVIDQAVEMVMPDERYWTGYEAGLRIRLQQQRPNLKKRLTDWLSGFGFLTARPFPLAAGVALALLTIGLWWILQPQPEVNTKLVATGTPRPTTTPQSETGPPGQRIAAVSNLGKISNTKKQSRPITAKRDGRSPSVPREGEGGIIVANNFDPGVYDEPRNASSIFTPEYEKQLSQRLLYQNILLRREAELKGNLPAEEALGELEPFLLDIANLPDDPSPDDVRDIKERLQRKEIVAALQIYSAHPSQPTYQNQ